jgi:hypothetical protein
MEQNPFASRNVTIRKVDSIVENEKRANKERHDIEPFVPGLFPFREEIWPGRMASNIQNKLNERGFSKDKSKIIIEFFGWFITISVPWQNHRVKKNLGILRIVIEERLRKTFCLLGLSMHVLSWTITKSNSFVSSGDPQIRVEVLRVTIFRKSSLCHLTIDQKTLVWLETF